MTAKGRIMQYGVSLAFVPAMEYGALAKAAEERGFAAETQCRGRSRSFVEGCMTYVVERRKCARSCR